jgi:hypothetical protein
MPVAKTMRECYEVRENHEWANITMSCWENPPSKDSKRGMYYCGEIVINSSFGAWANTWTACGVPFKQFLASAGFDYLFTKFIGNKLDCFDGDASFEQIKKDVIERRKSGSLDKDEARDAWNGLMDEQERMTSGSEESYGYAMWDVGSRLDKGHPMRDYFNDPSGWPKATHYDRQAEGFWRELWPSFKNELKAEMLEVKDVAKTPEMPRVLVVVSGGIADSVSDAGVDVEVFDWDNYKDDPEGTGGVPEHFADLAESIGVPVGEVTVSTSRPKP